MLRCSCLGPRVLVGSGGTAPSRACGISPLWDQAQQRPRVLVGSGPCGIRRNSAERTFASQHALTCRSGLQAPADDSGLLPTHCDPGPGATRDASGHSTVSHPLPSPPPREPLLPPRAPTNPYAAWEPQFNTNGLAGYREPAQGTYATCCCVNASPATVFRHLVRLTDGRSAWSFLEDVRVLSAPQEDANDLVCPLEPLHPVLQALHRMRECNAQHVPLRREHGSADERQGQLLAAFRSAHASAQGATNPGRQPACRSSEGMRLLAVRHSVPAVSFPAREQPMHLQASSPLPSRLPRVRGRLVPVVAGCSFMLCWL